MKLLPYPKYKRSGIEWLGDIAMGRGIGSWAGEFGRGIRDTPLWSRADGRGRRNLVTKGDEISSFRPSEAMTCFLNTVY